VHRPELAAEAGSARLAAGVAVGDVARQLYPDGVLVAGEDLRQALRDTQALLAEPPRPLFEATFQVDGVLIRADLLLPDGAAWRVAEVKSATRVKGYYITDAAVQGWVLREAGLPVSRIEVAHIDSTFVYPGDGDYRGLFQHADVTQAVEDLLPAVPQWISAARATLAGADPCTAPGHQCMDPFECPFLPCCVPEQPVANSFPPEILPYGRGLAEELRAEGYDDLRDVPEGRLTNPKHQRIWAATRDEAPVLDPQARQQLQRLGWPRYYVDFETIQFPVPIWAGTRPYQQLPFQWSCHVEQRDGHVVHDGFLADGAGDPRRTFAESLLARIGTQGPILVWHAGFERTRLRELADAFPDLASALHAAIDRLFDLLPLARAHYYHRDMRGSWSIKSVLPTIAPELGYDALDVADGAMAQEAFQELLHAETASDRRAELRAALLRYCERDTWAMVRIAHHFEGRG
jgi:hypothetical protein